MFIVAAALHVLVVQSYSVVFGLLSPPFTSRRPSGSIAVPVQNMSEPAEVSRYCVAVFVAGSNTAVCVCVALLPTSFWKLNC
ncbi:putative membrane protein [Burkholderia pseudomallei MSHR4304]|nr:putative membrane protein [Burkholderia pseudomallei MSHR4304]